MPVLTGYFILITVARWDNHNTITNSPFSLFTSLQHETLKTLKLIMQVLCLW